MAPHPLAGLNNSCMSETLQSGQIILQWSRNPATGLPATAGGLKRGVVHGLIMSSSFINVNVLGKSVLLKLKMVFH